MKIDIIHSGICCEEISVTAVKVEPISAPLIGDVKSLMIRTNHTNRNISIDNAFLLTVPTNNSVSILGVVCIEPNDVRTKYDIPEQDIEKRNYHEFTYVLIDDRLFNEGAITLLLRQLLSLCVSAEPIDEVFWFSDNELFLRIINKVFKTCNEYYFQNEAEYFADKLITTHNAHNNREKYLEELIKKNAPK